MKSEEKGIKLKNKLIIPKRKKYKRVKTPQTNEIFMKVINF